MVLLKLLNSGMLTRQLPAATLLRRANRISTTNTPVVVRGDCHARQRVNANNHIFPIAYLYCYFQLRTAYICPHRN